MYGAVYNVSCCVQFMVQFTVCGAVYSVRAV